MVHHGCCVFFCPSTAPPIQHCIFMHFSWNIDFKLTPNTACLLSLTGKLPLLMPQQRMSSACLWTECCLISVKLPALPKESTKNKKNKRTSQSTAQNNSFCSKVRCLSEMLPLSTFFCCLIILVRSPFARLRAGSEEYMYNSRRALPLI